MAKQISVTGFDLLFIQKEPSYAISETEYELGEPTDTGSHSTTILNCRASEREICVISNATYSGCGAALSAPDA